ncbi:MAG TPA: hypothetical protein VGC90_04690 [Candidatus Limnocylindrales bacterium]
MAEIGRGDRHSVHHYRRASDRAAERATRAEAAGDATALRIASSQFEALIRRRAEHAETPTAADVVDEASSGTI